MPRRIALILFALSTTFAASGLRVSKNSRFLEATDGKPFFWLGDTGWLMFQKLDRAETERYLEDRAKKGFNVIQCMVLHQASNKNAAGAAALVNGDPGKPNVDGGYWDHVDWVADLAASKGLYLAMVPAWGSIARNKTLNAGNVEIYARFLADRYKTKANIIWLNGGDTQGDRETDVWKALGRTLHERDPSRLITYHPFGRTQSSTWFHNEPWLDFNMFQSGHRRYGQDMTPGAKDEDNYKYVQEDYARKPVKPTLDGEPSYEGIPQGLHDWKEPLWTDKDARRYAYWSVFAGSFGHTYGHAAIMSMMLSKPFFERVPDQSLVAGENGARYDYIAATRGPGYAMFYTHSRRPFEVTVKARKASWFDPRTGASSNIASFEKKFTPPDKNDWVLVLETAK
jgi:hypothetical protein